MTTQSKSTARCDSTPMAICLLMLLAPPPAFFFGLLYLFPSSGDGLCFFAIICGLLWLLCGSGVVFPEVWDDAHQPPKPPASLNVNFDKGRSEFATLPTVKQNGIWRP